MSTSFTEASFEKRINDDSVKARYNIFQGPNEQKEYFSKSKKTKTSKKTKLGKSLNKSKWAITEYDNDVKSEKTEDYGSNSIKSTFSDFDIDVNPLFSKTASATSKPAKKSTSKPAKKSTKKGGCGDYKKTGGKKKSNKKKSNKKKSKKSSRKK